MLVPLFDSDGNWIASIPLSVTCTATERKPIDGGKSPDRLPHFALYELTMIRASAACFWVIVAVTMIVGCAVRRVPKPAGFENDRVAVSLSIKGGGSKAVHGDSMRLRAAVNGITVEVFEDYSLVRIDEPRRYSEAPAMRLDHAAGWHRDVLTFLEAITIGTYDPRGKEKGDISKEKGDISDFELSLGLAKRVEVADFARFLLAQDQDAAPHAAVERWLAGARGASTAGMTTDQVMGLTRGEP